MSDYEIPLIFKNNNDELISQFWNAKPFPHIYIDDFLDDDSFQILAKAAKEVDIKPAMTFNSEIQSGKDIFSNADSPKAIQAIVDVLSHPEFVQQLSILTKIENIRPLTEFKSDFLPFKYFHQMSDGGHLGSHVDHSTVGIDNVHVLNCIFYITDKWESDWGGDSLFFSKFGFKEKARVSYKPNRLVIFLHTSQSFHGVSKLRGNRYKRSTIYMDYNLDKNKLENVKNQAINNGSKFIPKFWAHQTTFIPGSFKNFHRLKVYFKYLVKRVLRTY